ncbi:hypothetical protein L1987_07541 [Smallanthus sonchifolius]|uniref:Uncharacterized protein n=1 Tax=Smallanthus sonchifolius TaxID=185202 RepID=A0ACB9K0N9_9ASTR|nr:hypothetical protein L1987_07541 [Smallanthus sonchifolius]
MKRKEMKMKQSEMERTGEEKENPGRQKEDSGEGWQEVRRRYRRKEEAPNNDLLRLTAITFFVHGVSYKDVATGKYTPQFGKKKVSIPSQEAIGYKLWKPCSLIREVKDLATLCDMQRTVMETKLEDVCIRYVGRFSNLM